MTNWKQIILGNLTVQSLPHEWFTIGGTIGFIILPVVLVVILAKIKGWRWLWEEWFTSVDPKRIGIMYMIVAGFMLLRGGLDALMLWLQQALGASNMPGFLGAQHGYLSADHFQQIVTAHGNIMVFFVAMAFIFGLVNFIVPLQIGARDLAFPFLNTLGFWLYIAGVVMVNMFFAVGGQYAATGWLAIAPLQGKAFSPGTGVDYWIWSLQISGVGTTISALNFIVTIIKMRAPGMTMWKLPLFTWGSLCSMCMAVAVFPLLAATLFLSFFDRYLGTHFFTIAGGGDPMLYTSMIWMWGHPEVYILVLPAFGVFGEVVSVFSRKPIASYATAVLGMIGVSSLALSVWVHHFFTMGSGADVNAFFGLMSMVIAIPTAVLMYTWIATLYKGRIKFSVPMLWFLGFVWTFTIGGLSGVMLGIPPVDFQLHNSLFLVAHFHSNVVGGVLFGIFCGITYWFPKFAGFRLNERIGRSAFWFWIVGFSLSFIPMYILGLMGAVRRLDTYDVATGWQPLYIAMLIGGVVIAIGVALQLATILASVIERKRLVDTTGDPWDGRSLEWAAGSPPASYNFTVIPKVTTRDAFWEMKRQHHTLRTYEDIHVTKNTAAGIYISIFAFLAGFGFVWDIKWLWIVALVSIIVSLVLRAFNEDSEYTIPAAEVKKMEEERLKHIPKAPTAAEADSSEDMGVWDLVKFCFAFALDFVERKRWRKS